MAEPGGVDRAALAALVTEIGRFYVSDAKMRRAQVAIASALTREGAPTPSEVAAYLTTVTHYFRGFERETRVHLRDVERRLARASQLHFNLTAERGVAARRLEATQGVLARLRNLAAR